MAKKNISIIKLESLIDIKVSGAFYARIQDLLVYITSTADKETILKVADNIKNKKPISSALEYNIETILTLINEIEIMAKEQNLISEQEIDLPDEDEDDSKTNSTQVTDQSPS